MSENVRILYLKTAKSLTYDNFLVKYQYEKSL